MKRSTPVEREKQEPVIRDIIHDPLTDLIRQGARRIVFEALNAEIEDIVGMYRDRRMPDGSPSVVRNGYLPEREIMTGMGPIAVTVPRIRDRDRGKDGRITFSSSIVPPYVRKARDFESVIPWLYLRGVSTGNFQEALAALVGPQAAGLSPSTISRLKNVWYEEYKKWSSRSLAGKRYIYVWADGIYFGARMEDEKSCMLVLIGVTEDGRKELMGIMDGYRESSDSWSELLRDIKERGLEDDPMLAVGDGALGFWKALKNVWPTTKAQRCWKHKSLNVVDKLPKSEREKAYDMLQEIWMASEKKEAQKAFDKFLRTYRAKHPKATECLEKDRDALLAFYDFPAEHWQSIRTTNPIESTFSSVRLRTNTTRGCLSRNNILAMTYKLILSAGKRWRSINSPQRLKELIEGKKFRDGELYEDAA